MKLYQLLVNQPHLKKYATVKVAVHFPRNLGLSPLKNNLSCHWPRKKEHLAICNAF